MKLMERESNSGQEQIKPVPEKRTGQEVESKNPYQKQDAIFAIGKLLESQIESYNKSDEENSSIARARLQEYSSQLNKLFSFKNEQENAKNNPEKYSEALGFVASMMERHDPLLSKDDSQWNSMDDEGKKESEAFYKHAKTIFMEASRLLFPDLKTPDSAAISGSLKLANSLLDNAGLAGLNKSAEDFRKEYQKDPKQFLFSLANHLKRLSERLETGGFETAINDGNVDSKQLRVGTAMLYQMELIKDKIQREVYGQASTVKEMREVDGHREDLAGQRIDLNQTLSNLKTNRHIIISQEEETSIQGLDEDRAKSLNRELGTINSNMAFDRQRVGSEKADYYNGKVRETFEKYGIK